MAFVLAQEATISFGAALAWLAGILGSLVVMVLGAAGTFAWRADKKLGQIILELRHIVRTQEDHENRIRRVEGKP